VYPAHRARVITGSPVTGKGAAVYSTRTANYMAPYDSGLTELLQSSFIGSNKRAVLWKQPSGRRRSAGTEQLPSSEPILCKILRLTSGVPRDVISGGRLRLSPSHWTRECTAGLVSRKYDVYAVRRRESQLGTGPGRVTLSSCLLAFGIYLLHALEGRRPVPLRLLRKRLVLLGLFPYERHRQVQIVRWDDDHSLLTSNNYVTR
jgi:hypothetical protein